MAFYQLSVWAGQLGRFAFQWKSSIWIGSKLPETLRPSDHKWDMAEQRSRTILNFSLERFMTLKCAGQEKPFCFTFCALLESSAPLCIITHCQRRSHVNMKARFARAEFQTLQWSILFFYFPTASVGDQRQVDPSKNKWQVSAKVFELMVEKFYHIAVSVSSTCIDSAFGKLLYIYFILCFSSSLCSITPETEVMRKFFERFTALLDKTPSARRQAQTAEIENGSRSWFKSGGLT